jgi:phosphopantothenoylcysteine decarboxylase/phosphopantothenate--cysteine ligase
VLTGKKILVGVTGGIAAYKTAELVRLLVKAGSEVRVVMTQSAKSFITPLTFQALSGNSVSDALLDPAAEAGMGHIQLAKWADLIVIAPASANFLARFSLGMADDLLSTLCLASASPVMLAPAMNQQMWANVATQENIQRLISRVDQGKVTLIGPASGGQACGDLGAGRMEESATIFECIKNKFAPVLLFGKRVVITAGPTREAIDPVRYLSNHSSGKMGYALAEAAANLGAEVILISGPVSLPVPQNVQFISVSSAREMLLAAENAVKTPTSIFIAAAAVADFRPEAAIDQKIKKKGEQGMQLSLVLNPDIVASIAASSNRPDYMVGFAAETQHVLSYAKKKREKKGLEMVIANDVSETGIGFNSDENAVIVIEENAQTAYSKMSKAVLAYKLLMHITKSLETL